MRAFAAFLVLSAIGAWSNVSSFDSKTLAASQRRADLAHLPRPEVAHVLALGFDAFAADLYWVGGLHYFGEPKNRRVCYSQLSSYIDLVNYLAPDFESAYRLGGLAIVCYGRDGWQNIPEAIAVLRRGVARFPNNWLFHLLLAYHLSTYQKQYQEAGRVLLEAAPIPGAPPYLGRLAARMFSQVEDYDTAEQVTRQLYEATTDPVEREALERRTKEIKTTRDLVALRRAVAEFRGRTGRVPRALEELVGAGLIAAIPEEALGGTWEYDADTGTVDAAGLVDPLRLFDGRP